MTQVANEEVAFSDPNLPVKAYITNCKGYVNFHLHNEIEWLYSIKGQMTVKVMDETIVLDEGDIIIINSFVIHSTINEDENNHVCLIQFNPDVLVHNTMVSEYKYAIPFMCQDRFRYKVIRPDFVGHQTEIAKLLLETASEAANKQIGYEIMIKSNLYKLLALLYRFELIAYEKPSETSRAMIIKSKMAKVIAHIERHYDELIEVPHMAKLAELNPDYFSRVFKSVTGQSLIQYINTVRISIAEKLLITTERQITDILLETGFTSLSYFNRTFKKTKLCSPREYRRRVRTQSNLNDSDILKSEMYN